MIEIIILYILNKYDCSIYKIAKLSDEFFFAYLKSSIGTISPALNRLEKLACVEYAEKMSDGGMKTKIYSITREGKKHLNTLLNTFEIKNPSRILNDIKIALYCSDVLEDKSEFRENVLNILQLYKINLEKGLNNEYISLNEIQKNTVRITLKDTEELIKLL